MLELPDFLTRDKYGQIDLKGHRIGLYNVVDQHQRGRSVEEIVEEYPTLTTEEVRRVLDYYAANRDAADAYVTDYRAEIERQRALYQGPTIEEMRARMQRRLAEKA